MLPYIAAPWIRHGKEHGIFHKVSTKKIDIYTIFPLVLMRLHINDHSYVGIETRNLQGGATQL